MKKLMISSLFFLSLFFIQTVDAQSWWGKGIKGEGPIVTKTLDLSNFSSVGLSISAKVYLTQGSKQSVKVEAQENIIENLKTKVSKGSWNIGFRENVGNHKAIKIYITLPSLEKVAVGGSGTIEGTNHFPNLDKLAVAVSGSGKVKLDVATTEITSAVSGSGNIHLEGSTEKHRIAVSGSGNIQA
ncbi:MAG: head GIN domain-containing protein, partial [Bacteroidota bacterium]